MRKAAVLLNDSIAGYLYEYHRDNYAFIYDENYYLDPSMPAVSLTLPKTQREYKSSKLFPFFFNMLSEGVNKKMQTRQFQLDENDDFGLLLKTAEFDTIGAVTVREITE